MSYFSLRFSSNPTAATLMIALCLPGCLPRDSAPTETADLIENRGEGKDSWWQDLPRPAWQAVEALGERQGWFEVYRAAPGVFAIHEPGQFEEVTSYLITGDERALLFDTGLGIADIEAVVRELTDLPIVVVNSHTHYDHVGGNHAFDFVYGVDTEFTRRHAAGRSHQEVEEAVGEGWIWKATPEGFSPADFVGRPFEISEQLVDGQRIDLGGRQIEVLLTPGHAPDALCLLDLAAGLLFTGDTYYPATLYAHLDGSDLLEYQASARRLATLVPELNLVLPAHNEPLAAPEVLERLAQLLDAVVQGEVRWSPSDGNRLYQGFDLEILVAETAPGRDSLPQ